MKTRSNFKSVRFKLFLTLCFVIAVIVLCLVAINSIVLESFYTIMKINNVRNEFDKINGIRDFSDQIVQRQLRKDSESYGFEILIQTSENFLVFSSNDEFTNTINKNEDLPSNFNLKNKERKIIIYTEENMVIERLAIGGLNSILLSGELDNGYKIYIQLPVEAIEESVRISNNLLIMMGIIAIIIAGIAASIVSKRFTNQILQLNIIANKMSKLDFSSKYKLTEDNDEINELGNSINIMSEKLESTIKQLKQNNSELERDIEYKSKIDEMRKQFISDVSHELKTPIALIQGYAEGLIENVNADEDSKKYYAEVIADEANHMDKLVKQLLELMKLEYGKREFNNQEFNICELINETIRKCNVMLEEKNIKDVRFDQQERVTVYADEFYIDQVITNYFTNAIKNTLEINGEKYIEIKIKKEENTVRISVFNTGKQIPEDKIDRIWGRFYKADESRNRDDGGSGIGLSIVKAIMNNYKAKYGVENKENGVDFYFELPTHS